jgi:D-beta-D-heptose 7-phosphate kinase/D-beta-D-heptose 1-phosphate adenosyltransferase
MSDHADGCVLVVGPTILDQYYVGEVSRLDQTAPVPIIDVPAKNSFVAVGGAANAALNLTHMGLSVVLVTVTGNDAAGDLAIQALSDAPNLARYCTREPGYQTPRKHRVHDQSGRLLCRYDIDEKPKACVEDKVVDLFQRAVDDMTPEYILISDYDKGICTERTLDVIFSYSESKCVPVIVDPVPHHMDFYRTPSATPYIITPNAKEAMAYTGLSSVAAAANEIGRRVEPTFCIVTCGADGLLVAQPRQAQKRVSAVSVRCVDSNGAGDTVAAALTYASVMSMPLDALCEFAVAAGALSVEALGARPVPLIEIHRRQALAAGPQRKCVAAGFAMTLRRAAAASGKRFGIANGVFDLLHDGHMLMLKQAAEGCDYLLVLLNSDVSVAALGRDVLQNTQMRMSALCATPYVDAVLPFDGATPVSELQQLKPDVLFKGKEHRGKEHKIPEAATIQGYGGEVKAVEEHIDIHAADLRAQLRGLQNGQGQETPSPATGLGEQRVRSTSV